ncbi:helix-turn-helix domain-containing protein [Streptomyces sp. Je 1-79]|uniref:helix-turn-helix domain-containing protein n=1 Tax=Streptomyces sp. Je 1-79 TaxID=2943847 RepID=UPI0021A5893F|nr:helix-turn-helix domain-containing protein [Streptomyces sp. Je 1-79]MCT4356547.1 helix-turn-helix domain-containing protein [Streptomyces sp. Je 1-79]
MSARAGVTHVRHRHDEKFTVVGNHLAQHEELSACAIGVGVYIQSLPDGALVGIKVLAHRFREGESRIAGALRELEAAGYLRRQVVRGENAKLATVTTWYENPHPVDLVKRSRPVRREPRPEPPRAADDAGVRPARRPVEPSPSGTEVPELTEELKPAAALLAGLRQREPRLLLSESDVRRLAPEVQRWLERDVTPAAVARTLAGALPTGTIRWPARLLAHRLREWLPPELPPAPEAPTILPLQNCDRCDRAFRGAEEGLCADCDPRGPGHPGPDPYPTPPS